nr:MAG TPA: hypothetical protein [Caudoviricetes sp.]
MCKSKQCRVFYSYFPYTSPVREHRALFNRNIHF